MHPPKQSPVSSEQKAMQNSVKECQCLLLLKPRRRALDPRKEHKKGIGSLRFPHFDSGGGSTRDDRSPCLSRGALLTGKGVQFKGEEGGEKTPEGPCPCLSGLSSSCSLEASFSQTGCLGRNSFNLTRCRNPISSMQSQLDSLHLRPKTKPAGLQQATVRSSLPGMS